MGTFFPHTVSSIFRLSLTHTHTHTHTHFLDLFLPSLFSLFDSPLHFLSFPSTCSFVRFLHLDCCLFPSLLAFLPTLSLSLSLSLSFPVSCSTTWLPIFQEVFSRSSQYCILCKSLLWLVEVIIRVNQQVTNNDSYGKWHWPQISVIACHLKAFVLLSIENKTNNWSITNCVLHLRAYLAALPTNPPQCSRRVWSRNGRERCSGMLHDVITQMIYRVSSP